jgi:hypothetical protein
MVEGGDPKTGPEIKSAIVNVDLVGVEGVCTASTTLVGPSAPVVQVNVPIMNVSPAGRTMEAGKSIIWLAIESARTTPTWRATIDEMWSAVYRVVCLR